MTDAREDAAHRLGWAGPIVKYDDLEKKVAARVPHGHVRYSAFKTHRYPSKPGVAVGLISSVNEWLIHDNTDAIAVRGQVIFELNATGWGDGDDTYRSGVETDPTWIRVAQIADEAIAATGDTHHCFLEGIERVKRPDPIPVYVLLMGS